MLNQHFLHCLFFQVESEREHIKKQLERFQNELDAEPTKGNRIQKVLTDAEALLKLILGEKTTGPLRGMIEKLSGAIDNKRGEKLRIAKVRFKKIF